MKISEQVENILKASHKARNSDKELLIIYMQLAGMKLSDEQIETFKQLPSMETIRRTRQSIQEQGKYEADPEVEQARYTKFKQVRQFAPYMKPEDVEKQLESQGIKILPWGN